MPAPVIQGVGEVGNEWLGLISISLGSLHLRNIPVTFKDAWQHGNTLCYDAVEAEGVVLLADVTMANRLLRSPQQPTQIRQQ